MSFKIFKIISKFNGNQIRNIATSSIGFNKANVNDNQLVLTEVNDKTGYAVISLNRAPVNSFNTELYKTFNRVIDDLEKNKTRGAILTSVRYFSKNFSFSLKILNFFRHIQTLPTVFSAGLDITELNNPDPQKLREFWTAGQDCFLKLHGSSFPVAAALNGHTIAAGCFSAMCCEYRVMVPGYKIGANEVTFGVPVPRLLINVLSTLLSKRDAEFAAITGKLYSTEEALSIGFIDEIAKDKAEAIAKCEAFITRFKKTPPLARGITKQFVRNKELEYIQNNREKDLNEFVQSILNPESQQSIKTYYETLSKKK
jgi:Delta3-Delta2-enoyl-CoA isomerase